MSLARCLRVFGTLTSAIVLGFYCIPIYADHVITHHTITHAEKLEIINERFRFYDANFPEIKFIFADGGDDWQEDMLAIISLLGNDAVNLDYEHPPELAKTLLDANLARIAQMLESNIVSATLFKVGSGSLSPRPYVCTITLNPEEYISDSKDALSYMIDLSNELMLKVHPTRYLDTYEHLRFTIDHEAFHCLESYLLGGAPMTKKKLGGEYNLFKRESGADAYALAMQMHNAGATSDYARNITHIRALWLFTESPNRCTYGAMLGAYQTPPKRLARMTLKELFDFAVNIRDQTVGNYEFYVVQRATAFKAAKKLGHEPKVYGDIWHDIEKIKTDPKNVDYKLKRYHYYFSQLFTGNTIEFTPVDIPIVE